MKCITYGWVVFLMIVLSALMVFSPLSAPTTLGIYVLCWVLLHVYWLYGWTSTCPDGFLGGLKK